MSLTSSINGAGTGAGGVGNLAFGGAPMVRVVNTGDAVFSDGFANVTYTIEPGKSAFVPGEAALLWFGDNGLFDIDSRNRPREAERRRLRVKYGVYNDHDQWDNLTPSVEVYDLDGNRLYTLIEDPDGVKVLEDSGETAADPTTDVITARMLQMERELATLRQALASQVSGDEAERRGEAEDDGQDGEEQTEGEGVDSGTVASAPDLTQSNASDGKTAGDKGVSNSPEPTLLNPPSTGSTGGAKKDGPSVPPVKS